MDYRQLMKEFSARLGISDVAFDNEGVASFMADEIAFSFKEDPQTRSLYLWGPVATPPPEEREPLYALMFEAMFLGRATHGSTFSLCDGVIFLHRRDSLVDLDCDRLALIVEDFINTIDAWRKVVEDFRPSIATKRTAEAGHPHSDHHGFIPV